MRLYILWGVFVLALLSRVIGLSTHPTGFTPDEASFGYDAYSILKTGKDQWGNSFPLTFKSFGDYKMPLYAYVSIPTVAIFGLSEFAVRLPNALLGSLAVLVTYLLVFEVFKDKKTAIFSSLLLAVSPWHIPMSRGAFEANLTTFFMPLGIYAFFRGIKSEKWMVLSAVVFGLNMFTYHSARLVTPFVVFGLFWFYRDKLNFKKYQRSLSILIVFFGIAFVTYFGGAGARATSAGIFQELGNAGNDQYQAVLVGEPQVIARAFNNKVFYFFDRFISNYLQYYSPEFWFARGPGEWTYGMVPGRGVLYLAEVVLVIGFLWGLFKNKFKDVSWLIVWFLVSAVPAALSTGPGYAANRATVMMPAIHILLALGGVYLYSKFISKKTIGRMLLVGYLLAWFVGFIFFANDYLYQQKAGGAKGMSYGARQAMEILKKIEGNYNEIVISKSISEAHIFVAFYGKLDPEIFQNASKGWMFEELGVDWVDQIPEYTLEKYTFRNIDWIKDSQANGTLLIGSPGEFPEGTPMLEIIRYPNGQDAYWIVEI